MIEATKDVVVSASIMIRARDRLMTSQIDNHAVHPDSAPTIVSFIGASHFQIGRGASTRKNRRLLVTQSKCSGKDTSRYGLQFINTYYGLSVGKYKEGKNITDEDLINVFLEQLFFFHLEDHDKFGHDRMPDNIGNEVRIHQAIKIISKIPPEERIKLFESCVGYISSPDQDHTRSLKAITQDLVVNWLRDRNLW